MAATQTYQDAWTLARNQYRVGIDQLAMEYATNLALAEMWKLYDWRGTILNLTPFWLVPGETDYGKPFYSVPADFYGLRECYLVDVSSNQLLRKPLQVQKNLERSGQWSFPAKICYRESINGFRVWPCPSFGMSSPVYMIDGTYKNRPPKILRAQLATVIPFDDVYFNTFTQACAWAALVASGDRQSALQQYAQFRQFLAADTSAENLELGEDSVHPSEPLMLYDRSSWFAGWP